MLVEFGSALVKVSWPMTARAACPFTKSGAVLGVTWLTTGRAACPFTSSAAYKAAEQKRITGIHFMGNIGGRILLALVKSDYSKR
jgi:hypothetical protein